ncbi:hypothetical protein [Clostridium sp. KNHs214]|uniref:hypothetical protein n=1 Tax=Clostridium sp. KNHs214 TaxID=1540257 RepID=UPI00054FC519|nr:hypothetical protein [Clostridium sp. KNHs214]
MEHNKRNNVSELSKILKESLCPNCDNLNIDYVDKIGNLHLSDKVNTNNLYVIEKDIFHVAIYDKNDLHFKGYVDVK